MTPYGLLPPPPPPDNPPPPNPPPYYPAPRPGPYSPAPGLTYAGFWIRVLAWLIDAIIIGLPLSILATFLHLSSGVYHSTCSPPITSGLCVSANFFPYSTFDWLELGIASLYSVLLWSLYGATLGQRLLGLGVVDAATGSRISIPRAFGRLLGYLLSFWALFIGVIWVGFDAQKQGWHDKLASTFVVRRG